MKKIREYVNKNYGIDCSKLSDEDTKKLAKFYLTVTKEELPLIANSEAEKIGFDFVTNKFIVS